MAYGEVANTADAYKWSIRKIAEAFKMGRDTVSKKIALSGVLPSGSKNGHPVYAIHEIAPFLFKEDDAINPGDEDFDPEKLPTKERKEWYEGTLKRDEVLQIQGTLVKAEESRAEMAEMVKTLVSAFACLPDDLERICNLDGRGVEHVQQVIDSVRNKAADKLDELDVRICDCDKAGCNGTGESA
ncbi:DUF1441 family protein [Hahella ganghwensis]|uniref:DUF1441 family protein n=1 Tax=Hahella ganghwensis TaxID=286420 RepID=UPI00035C24F3|nr:DUF1441 family protein [Hahella ganghwensis]